MTPSRRLEIECAANLYGSANCWTGTSGGLAAMIRELLADIDSLEQSWHVLKNMLDTSQELNLKLTQTKETNNDNE